MIRAAALCLVLLAACGADGAPEPPAGLAVSGDARVGVVFR